MVPPSKCSDTIISPLDAVINSQDVDEDTRKYAVRRKSELLKLLGDQKEVLQTVVRTK